MRERNRPPVHPGRIIGSHYVKALDMNITSLAGILGISRKTASKIVNERGAVTPDMALRLSRAFNTTPHLWLGLQQECDLWHAAHDSSEWKKVQSAEALQKVSEQTL